MQTYPRPQWLAVPLLTLVALLLLPLAGRADDVVQIKPRILIMFDTSGSMVFDIQGNTVWGDGSNDPWTGGRRCCPGTGGSRMYIAKEAMKKMLNASGDIDFALAKFAQRYRAAGWEADWYYNNQTNNEYDYLRYNGDSSLFGTQANWLSVPFKEYASAEILSWMDHHEFSSTNLGTPDTSIYPGPFNDYTEQELRADGGTPIGPAIDAAQAYLASVRADEAVANPYVADCRPYSVILLTDGEADSHPAARTAVQNLHSDGIDTWVIGLAIASTNLDELAADGGGHFDPVTGRAFFADSEDSLASILYQIVAGSVRVEVCNGIDDNCNGQIDEGVTNRCGECGPEPEEVCDGSDNDCDGDIDNGLTPPSSSCSHIAGYPAGNRGECLPGVLECQGAAGWVCVGGVVPRAEVCDGLDNDCDGVTDEDVDYFAETGTVNECSPSPFAGIGECDWGAHVCSNGSWVCQGYGEPTLEGVACDGLDNDCDGEADEGISQVCGGGDVNGGTSICRQGVQYCDADLSLPGDPVWSDCYGSVAPRTEVCNLLDDNCDGYVDNQLTSDTHAWLNQACGGGAFNVLPATCRQGLWVCKDGAKTCCRDGVSTCNSPISPTSELAECDGLDNDCDGQVDENIREQCWVGQDEGQPNHGDTGQCVLGWRVCNADPDNPGWAACVGAVGPSAELCDGIDNDCDGSTDEGLENLGSCGGAPVGDPNEGQCSAGTLVCSGGKLSCVDEQGPTTELCDGLDNDCDGETDEGLYQACWSIDPPPNHTGICRPGVQQCIGANQWSDCIGDVLPAEYEICNNLDDNCDGQTDENPQGVVGQSCNQCGDLWECRPGGVLFCQEANSSAEICDGLDNDCNGLTDEVTNPCGGCVGAGCTGDPNEGACREGFQYCDSAAAMAAGYAVWKDCVGAIGPSSEVCDGIDNDCDGETDEDLALVGQECAKAIGECEAATLQCVNLSAGGKGIKCCASVDPSTGQCVSPQGPELEICDGKDNNCDSLTDEGLLRPCSGCLGAGCTSNPNEGQCQQGIQRCVDADWGACQGSTGPVFESCNLLDDDCDGLTDEDVVFDPPTCSHSNTSDPNEGICEPGNWTCNEDGNPECLGGTKPTFEVCNGLDDDCDGKQDWDTDEELDYVGEPCGSSNLGVCKRGAWQCICDTDLAECELVCVGGVLPSTEECNCLDDDCDGLTDNDIPAGGSCNNAPEGVATGACTEGVMRCIDCEWVCDAPYPGLESCNGIDDDCDGSTDENLDVECPEDHICIEGECAPPCFGQEAGCPSGKVCEEVYNPGTGEMVRVCVSDVCSPGMADALPCASNPYYCSDESAIPPCQCSSIRKACVSPCEDLVCQEGEVCVATVTNKKVSAQCVKAGPGCYGAGCSEGEKCEGGECVSDPCAGKTCEEDSYCKDGECVAACAEQDCAVSCRDGECVDDPCAGKVCDAGLSCDPQTGQCVQGECWQKSCEYYQVCKDGQCVDNPCWNVDCPNGRRCVDGSCYDVDFEPSGGGTGTGGTDTDTSGTSTDTDKASDTVPDDTDTRTGPRVEDGELTKVLATGAGGCLCAATPGRPGSPHGLLWLLILPGLAMALRLRRRAVPVSLWLLGALVALLTLGCQVEPFEFGGPGGSGGPDTMGTDASDPDTMGTGGTDGTQGSGTEDSDTSTCRPGEPDDDCDGVDDDCDGLTDEDADLTTPAHCGACGNVCSFKNAFALCVKGKCQRGDCAPFWYDRDSNADDCEFFCQPTVDPADNLDLCDGVDLGDTDFPYVALDNDCDGEFDEDVGFNTDPRNCGRCGSICRVANAAPLCVGGECARGDCREDFYDNDSDTSNGCEYQCLPTEEGVEICDGKDNDCDGLTDEGEGPSAAWGAQGGGACYAAGDGGCDADGTNCKGACAPGTWKCEAGQLRCKEAVKAAQGEQCDNLDNDCDGVTDEEDDIPLMGPSGSVCAVQVGVCPEGRLRCARESVGGLRKQLCCADVDSNGVCVGVREGIPEHEDADQCDGLDNNCDGRIDESSSDPNVGMTGLPCYFGQLWGDDPDPNLKGRCQENPGVFRCYYGTWLCEGAASPVAETCNGIDDNCDGQTDEGLYQACHTGDYQDGAGLCRYGIVTCENGKYDGECLNEIRPQPEQCDNIDNDCDGQTDEPASDTAGLGGLADERVGQECGFGICRGTYICQGGVVVCDGGESAAYEDPCNGLDDDCDGMVDERDVWTCGGCDRKGAVNTTCALGANEGRCQEGSLVCEDGASVCRGEIRAEAELCDGLDNDCDGLTDEDNLGNPITGGSCGLCNDGTVTCEGGIMVCKGATIPSADICDGLNNDCNALTPDGSAEVWYGQPCDGPDGDLCLEGTYQCAELSPGVWGQGCSDSTGDSIEVCNGLDDDCNGLIDDSLTPPAGICNALCPGVAGEMCDSSLGWRCAYFCTDQGGPVECDSMGNPVPEETLCDGIDNDCDGLTDESFDKRFDPTHCGDCDNDCAAMDSLWPQFGSAVPQNVKEFGCQEGTCIILSCLDGFVDDRTTDLRDCSYECALTNGGVEICDGIDNDCDGLTDENATTEICDGIDNDCDGAIDEDLTLPAGRCLTRGVCAGVAAVAACEGADGWNCNYGLLPNYQGVETWCDGIDNDCDGLTDEGFATYGTQCSFGQGGCLRTGTYRCAAEKLSTVCCAGTDPVCASGNVITSGLEPTDELCDGIDNDCDGLTDEGVVAGEAMEYVTLTYGGQAYDVFLFEASRPDADTYSPAEGASNSSGVLATGACSAEGKVPWTMVNHTEAQAACQALNEPDADCNTEACWDLCPAFLWQHACEQASGSTWLYPYGNSYEPPTCNGHDFSSAWDRLLGTGFADQCVADWSAEDVYDLSGNAEEWTATSRTIGTTTAYEIRGGSYNDLAGGMTCDFDFWAAEADFRMPNLGFRCCRQSTQATCSASLAGVGWDFEGSSGSDWTRQGEWEIGTYSTMVGSSRMLATDLDNTYGNNQNISATAPAKDLTAWCAEKTVTLHFRMAHKIQNGSSTTVCDRDYGVLEVLQGSSWVRLDVSPGHTDATNKRWCRSSEGTWNTNPTWISYTADVTSYVSSAFQFRFRLVTNNTTQDRGMYIDDIYLSSQ